MDTILFYLIFFIIIAVVLFVIPYILYLIPKKFEHPKLGKILSSIFLLSIISVTIYEIFRDEFFTKSNAKEFLAEQKIILKDDFKIINNISHSAIGDYYHTFTLSISEKDRQRIIQQIKNAKNFKIKSDTTINHLLYLNNENRYFGKKIIQNYETNNHYVTEFFEPSNQKGYAPTFQRISVSKTENMLTFKDINE